MEDNNIRKLFSFLLSLTLLINVLAISASASTFSQSNDQLNLSSYITVLDKDQVNTKAVKEKYKLSEDSLPDAIVEIDSKFLERLEPGQEVVLYDESFLTGVDTIPTNNKNFDEISPMATVRTYARLEVRYRLDELILTTEVYSDALNYYFNYLTGEHTFDSDTTFCFDEYENGSPKGKRTLAAENSFYLPGAKGMQGIAASNGEHTSNQYGTVPFSRSALITIK